MSLPVSSSSSPVAHLSGLVARVRRAGASPGALTAVAAALVSALALGWVLAAGESRAQAPATPAAAAPAKPALTVQTVAPQSATLPVTLDVNGNVAPWQEALVGAEAAGLRLIEVRADVGDRVARGAVLARFDSAPVRADLAQAEAALAEARATLAEAAANAQRARGIAGSGALSEQAVQQFLVAEQTAAARVAAQEATVQAQRLRLAQTEVRAPDAGVISARSATVGAVAGAGQELFRLIRGGRLEWRAEVPSADIGRVRAGQAARVTTPSGAVVEGAVRRVAPTVDTATRNGLVYVDLKPGENSDVRAGMFVRGSFRFDSAPALTVPASALILRDGFEMVVLVDGESRARASKVRVLGREGDRVAIDGLPATARVVVRGGAFLTDGDLVRVVDAPRS